MINQIYLVIEIEEDIISGISVKDKNVLGCFISENVANDFVQTKKFSKYRSYIIQKEEIKY